MSKKILIAEDEAVLRQAYETILKKEGYDVYPTENGKVALETAEKIRPDLILLDLKMPVMDGITMLQKLREKEENKDIRVIVITNFGDWKIMELLKPYNISDFLIKAHWKPKELVGLVKDALK